MENWRVLLAESQPKLRQNMVKFLTETNGVSLVAKVANGWDVMFTSSQLQPDIVLLDFTMPGLNGTEVASLLKRWILGTHQGAVVPEHLQSYLEEFTFRFNRRKSGSRGLVFRRLLEQAAATTPITEAAVTHGYDWSRHQPRA